MFIPRDFASSIYEASVPDVIQETLGIEPGSGIPGPVQNLLSTRGHGAATSFTSSFSPQLCNFLRFGFIRNGHPNATGSSMALEVHNSFYPHQSSGDKSWAVGFRS
jgi:hypothetical protein